MAFGLKLFFLGERFALFLADILATSKKFNYINLTLERALGENLEKATLAGAFAFFSLFILMKK